MRKVNILYLIIKVVLKPLNIIKLTVSNALKFYSHWAGDVKTHRVASFNSRLADVTKTVTFFLKFLSYNFSCLFFNGNHG